MGLSSNDKKEIIHRNKNWPQAALKDWDMSLHVKKVQQDVDNLSSEILRLENELDTAYAVGEFPNG